MYYFALGVEYNGSAYKGFQRQNEEASVQGELEKAISIVANENIVTYCAGRTDAGVHGTGQVINFATNNYRGVQAWTIGVNANLPKDISITWAKEVDESFHARFSAVARRYRYIILNSRCRSGIGNNLISHYHTAHIDHEKMNEAAQCLVGEHDFSSFRGAGCQSRSPMRNVHHVFVKRYGDYVIVDIKANAFLLHMVRNIVGTLLEVGFNRKPIEWVKEVFEAKDRNKAGPTAQPYGLYLVDVSYPDSFDLPKRNHLGPLFLD